MTRKDYVAIAKVVAETRAAYADVDGEVEKALVFLTHRMANVMAADNARFSRETFVAACEASI